jgi:hypothetical protein
MPDISQERVSKEAAALEEQRRARVYKTVGKWLLWTDLIPAVFVYTGVRGGSYMWLVWVLVQGFLAFVLIGIGASRHRRAEQVLLSLSPVRGEQDLDSDEEPERRAS